MDFKDVELELEIKALRDHIDRLESENRRIKDILHANDLSEELGEEKPISAEEEVCVKGIEVIRELVRNKTFTKNDVQNFDIFYKNLRLIQGKDTDSEVVEEKPIEVAELLKLVSNDDSKAE